MFIDAKIDYKSRKLLLIDDQGFIEEKQLVDPYFYVIIPSTFKGTFIKLVNGLDVVVEETSKTPVIWDGRKYVTSRQHIVFRVATDSPSKVPELAQKIYSFNRHFDTRISAHNVRYIVRNCFDNDVKFFNAIPLYYGFDSKIIDHISKVKVLIIDVEVIDGQPKLASCYIHQPFTPVNKDDVISLELPNQLDELVKLIRQTPIVAGYNLFGFDIPVLKRLGVVVDDGKKCIFDVILTLTYLSSSFQIGSARSLLDVAIVLKDKLGITDEEIEIKRRSRKILKSSNWDEIVKYNVNDIVLTAKILDPTFAFCATLSAYTQIPISEVQKLTVGTMAEYFLLRFCELNGFVPEYSRVSVELEHSRVYVEAEGKEYRNVLQTDIKMMYPSFVKANYIDPSLLTENGTFDRKSGIGLLYSAVRRLYIFREFTKKLKKQDKRFEAMDLGVKALVNALAYGVQGKGTSWAIFGNPITPAKIFYGTADIQFKTIQHLREKGIKVIYSDTDSFFVELRDRKPEDILKTINEFLSQFGLEADVEDVWDSMYIYAPKNYVLRKGEKVIVKGGALLNLKKFYLPEAISLQELLKIEDKKEREKYIKDVLDSCEIHELFTRTHQQVWRLIGKDYQSVKRSIRLKLKKLVKESKIDYYRAKQLERAMYLRVLTPWQEKPIIYLKKLQPYMLTRPDEAPLVKLYMNYGMVVDLSELTAHDIVEVYSLKLDELRIKNLVGDLLVWDEDIYVVKIKDMRYVLRFRDKEVEIPSYYQLRQDEATGIPFRTKITKIVLNYEISKVKIDEDVLRQVVFSYVKKKLREYGLL